MQALVARVAGGRYCARRRRRHHEQSVLDNETCRTGQPIWRDGYDRRGPRSARRRRPRLGIGQIAPTGAFGGPGLNDSGSLEAPRCHERSRRYSTGVSVDVMSPPRGIGTIHASCRREGARIDSRTEMCQHVSRHGPMGSTPSLYRRPPCRGGQAFFDKPDGRSVSLDVTSSKRPPRLADAHVPELLAATDRSRRLISGILSRILRPDAHT
jgi:hypothetical protein